MGQVFTSPLMLGPCLAQTSVYLATVSVSVCVSVLLCFRALVSLVTPPWLLESFHLLFLGSLSPEGKDLMETLHLGLHVLRGLIFLTVQLRVCALICCRRLV